MDEKEHELRVQGDAQGFILGDHNIVTQVFTSNRDLGTMLIRLVAARDLNPESFELGDKAAATFPYVTTPIQGVYNRAVQVLQQAATTKTAQSKRGILISGESSAGKTRLAFEALKKALPLWPVLCWRRDDTIDKTPPELLTGKELVVFIDDLQDFVVPQSQSFFPSPHASMLNTLLGKLIETTQNIVVIATCRTEGKTRVIANLPRLLIQLEDIAIPSFNENEQDLQSAQIIAAFQQQGRIHHKEDALHIKDWDGTLGSLLLGLSMKNSQYLALSEAGAPEATILRAMKLLKLVHIDPTKQLLQAVSARVFGERRLQDDEKLWREGIRGVTSLQLAREEMNEKTLDMVLKIRHSIYFEKVITDYPEPGRPHQIEQDVNELQHVLVQFRHTQSLIMLSMAFFSSVLPEKPLIAHSPFEKMLVAVDNALSIDSNLADGWVLKLMALIALGQPHESAINHFISLPADSMSSFIFLPESLWTNKSTLLNMQGRLEEALVAVEKALSLNQSYSNAWSTKGNILLRMGHFAEGLVAVEKALSLDENDTLAWYSKGWALYYQEHLEEALDALYHVLALNAARNNRNSAEYDSAQEFVLRILKILMETEKYAEAVTVADQILSFETNFETNHIVAWRDKADALRSLKQYEGALKAIDQILTLSPTDEWALYKKGLILQTIERYPEALACFNQANSIAPERIDSWRQKGYVLARLEWYEECLSAWDQVLASEPDDTEIWYNSGIVLGKLGRYKECLLAWDHVLAQTPDNTEIWYYKGVTLEALEEYDEVLAVCDHILVSHPEHIDAWRLKGNTLARLERHEESLLAWDHVLAQTPDDIDLWRNRAVTLHILQRDEEALDRILALNPMSVNTLRHKRWILSSMRRLAEVVTVSDQILALDSSLADDWNHKGAALVELGRYEEALIAFDHALLLEPENSEVWLYKGAIHMVLNQYREAVTVYDHLLALNPNDVVVWNNKGLALSKLEYYNEAIEAFDHACHLSPSDVSLLSNKGEAFLATEKYEEALLVFDQILTIAPDISSVWTGKGRLLAHMNRHQAALLAFDHALDINPQDIAALSNKGDILITLGKFTEALDTSKHLLALNPSDFRGLYVRGQALSELGQFEEATLIFDQMLSYDDTSFTAWFKKGWALYRLKRYEEALLAYDSALALVPDSWEIWSAKGLILIYLRKPKEALIAFDHVLFLEPKNTTCLGFTVFLHLALKQYNEALVTCDLLLTLDPQQEELLQPIRQSALEALEGGEISYDPLATLTAILDMFAENEKS